MRDRLEQMRDEIRAWARRPTTRSAAVARARVGEEIGGDRSRPRWQLAATASSAAVGLLAVVLVLTPQWSMNAPDGEETVDVQSAGPLLVYELSSGTKLYLALEDQSSQVGKAPLEGIKGEGL